MNAPLIKLSLTHDERRALEEIAVEDMRRPDDVLRWLLREELKRRKRKHCQEKHNKVTLLLTEAEWRALCEIAKSADRTPKLQARYMVRAALGMTDQEKHNDAVSIRQDMHSEV